MRGDASRASSDDWPFRDFHSEAFYDHATGQLVAAQAPTSFDASCAGCHATGFRLAVNRNWSSRWYANNRNFAPMLAEDIKVRDFLRRKLAHASVGRVLIERPAKDARITIFSARPGVVIGKKGEEIEALKAELRRLMGVNQVHVNIEEIRKPEIDAQLIADSIAQQLEKRIMFRRAMKRAMQNAMRLGAQGIKIMSSGDRKSTRLNSSHRT